MNNRKFLFAGLFLLCTALLWASHPQRKTTSTFDEFLEGEAQGMSITSDGRLVLAPEFSQILDTEEAFIYSAVSNRAGTLFVGTGNNGKIFRITPTGEGKEWSKLGESGIYALAVDSSNRVYAGTGPEGKVYRLNGEGESELFYEPGEKYIWDLAFDPNDNLYVATGPKGIVYKVNPDGTAQPFYDSEETHIVSLEWDLDGNLLAGTAPGGLLIRISPAGKPFVLLDSSLEEMKAIAVDRIGNVFAAALSGGPKPGTESAGSSTESSTGSSDKTEESTVETAGNSKGAKLEVIRVGKDNLTEKLYASDDQLVFSMIARNDGNVLLATGNKGRILSVSPQGFITVLIDSEEEQVTQLIESGGKTYVFTSNLGKVFEVAAARREKGVFESDVLDAALTSRWGVIEWAVGETTSPESIQLFTRSGNTENPDRTWSDWSAPYSRSSGEQVNSPAARFLQWKVEIAPGARGGGLLSENNALEYVSVTYLQQNAAPKLSKLTVHAPGVAFIKLPQVSSSGGVQPGGPDGAHALSLPKEIRELETPRVRPPQRKSYIPGARSFSWEASDPNEDDLVYSVFYRREGERDWKVMLEETTEEEITIDGVSYPDGTYSIKVVVSDRLSNPKALAREDQLVSKSFIIANTAPTISWQDPQVSGRNATLSFSAQTGASPLYQVEYSIDGGDWAVVFAQDGITDQQQESFEVQLEDLATGSRTVRVRAVDLVGNLGTSLKTFQVQ